MYKSCLELIHEFNQMSTFIPTPLHNRIMEGGTITAEECGVHFRECLLAVALWHEIGKRVGEFPNYSTMLQ